MKKLFVGILMVMVMVVGMVSVVSAASVRKADMFNEHGLRVEAKKELINVIFSKASKEDKAKSYYLLGNIAFDETKISIALTSWKTLVSKYPNSKEALLVKDKITELAEIAGEFAEESLNNAIAQSYLRHANFWSKKKDSIFKIDSSWIPNIESSLKWYDKVIKEFPKTSSAKRAYVGKLRSIIGWEKSGRYGEAQGVRGNFSKYIPQLLDTFASFEADFPTSGLLQPFRYQIAQVYWGKKDWVKTKEWLNKIIEVAGEKDSFYKDLAERRLIKVKY